MPALHKEQLIRRCLWNVFTCIDLCQAQIPDKRQKTCVFKHSTEYQKVSHRTSSFASDRKPNSTWFKYILWKGNILAYISEKSRERYAFRHGCIQISSSILRTHFPSAVLFSILISFLAPHHHKTAAIFPASYFFKFKSNGSVRPEMHSDFIGWDHELTAITRRFGALIDFGLGHRHQP